jgi:hypothetical protein
VIFSRKAFQWSGCSPAADAKSGFPSDLGEMSSRKRCRLAMTPTSSPLALGFWEAEPEHQDYLAWEQYFAAPTATASSCD